MIHNVNSQRKLTQQNISPKSITRPHCFNIKPLYRASLALMLKDCANVKNDDPTLKHRWLMFFCWLGQFYAFCALVIRTQPLIVADTCMHLIPIMTSPFIYSFMTSWCLYYDAITLKHLYSIAVTHLNDVISYK